MSGDGRVHRADFGARRCGKSVFQAQRARAALQRGESVALARIGSDGRAELVRVVDVELPSGL